MIFRIWLFSFALLLVATAVAVVSPRPALAAEGCSSLQNQFNSYGGQFSNITEELPQYCTATGLLRFLINGILALVGGVTILFLVIGGFRYITSSGNQERVDKGKQTILWAAIGLAVVLMAAALVNIVINLVTGGEVF
jgi:hypothetical protein